MVSVIGCDQPPIIIPLHEVSVAGARSTWVASVAGGRYSSELHDGSILIPPVSSGVSTSDDGVVCSDEEGRSKGPQPSKWAKNQGLGYDSLGRQKADRTVQNV